MEGSPNVLVIDDEADVRDAIRGFLKSHGIEVDVASSPEEAKELLSKNKYQVITTDIRHENSPVSGDTFILENIEQFNDSSVIVYTANRADHIDHLRELQDKGVPILLKGDREERDRLLKLINEKLNETKPPPGFELIHTIDEDAEWIGQIAWSPDGNKLAARTSGRGVLLWNRENEFINLIDFDPLGAGGVTWSPDGKILAYTSRSKVFLFDAVRFERKGIVDDKKSDNELSPGLSWSPDGKTLAVGNRKGAIQLYTTERWELSQSLNSSKDWTFALAWSRDSSRLAAGGDDKVLRIWNVATGEPRTLKGHTDQITCLASCPTEDLLASGSADKSIRIWNPLTGEYLTTLQGHTERITSVAFSHDGSLFASKSIDGTVRLWRPDTWDMIATLEERASIPTGLYTPGIAFHPKELVLATLGHENAKIRIWKLNRSVLLKPDEESILSASVSDQPVSKDSLGFEPYVTALARFLTDERTQPPLTLSIEGEWGSGKSSFMLQLEEALKTATRRQRIKRLLRIRWMIRMRKERIPTPIRHRQWWGGLWPLLALPREERYPTFLSVRFNAWRHDKDSALWASFALALLHKLSRELPAPVRAWTHLKLTARRFKWTDGWPMLLRTVLTSVSVLVLAVMLFYFLYTGGIEKILGNASEVKGGEVLLNLIKGSGVFGLVVAFLYLLNQFKETIGNPFNSDLKKYLQTPAYDHEISFIEQFHEDFGNIVQTFAGKNDVYVFIDDLDRSEVPKAADLMQAINLLISDSPQVFFIVGIDRDKVAAGLAVKYEKLLKYLSVASKNGENAATAEDGDSATNGLRFGHSFIEKFIQIPFRIPQPAELGLSKLLDNISPLIAETTTTIDEPKSPPTTSEKKDDSRLTQTPSVIREASAPGPTTTTQTPASPPTPEQEERRELIRITVTRDSATVRKIVQMVAPALGYNPRRIKQFINMFRLKALIAAETGLFDAPKSGPSHKGLTLPQLGKFVAISLMWPRLLTDLDQDNSLLRELDKWATGQDYVVKPAFAKWMRESDLENLLKYGGVGDKDPFDDKKPADHSRYSLSNVDVSSLLRITPPVTQPPPVTTPTLSP